MRTARSSSRPGGCRGGGWSLLGTHPLGEGTPPGGSTHRRKHPPEEAPPRRKQPPLEEAPHPSGGSHPPPPVNGMTDACENITLPQTSLRPIQILQFICRQWYGDDQFETIGFILLCVMYFREDFDRYLQQAADDRRRTEEDRMYLEKLFGRGEK